MVARAADHNVYAGRHHRGDRGCGLIHSINPLWIFVAAGVMGLSGWL